MNCLEIEAQDIVERYLSRKLSEVERQAFEDHYFGCADCFERLRIARSFVANSEIAESKSRTASHFSGHLRLALLPIAALIVAAVLGTIHWKLSRSSVPPVQQSTGAASEDSSPMNSHAATEKEVFLSQLARIEPPPYTSKRLRGTEDESRLQFDRAMNRYAKGDYSATVPGLQKAALLSPKSVDVNFYLGVCYLLASQPEKAIDALKNATSPDAPDYAEQAHFYLAKAYLQIGNIASAQSELEATLAFHGVREGEARKLKEELSRLP